MDQLRVRCPACQKLYQVETQAIVSLTPHFDCRACHAVFAFEYPPKDFNQIETFLVHAHQVTESEAESSSNLESESFESRKEEVLPGVVLQAQPSLVQMWNQIFEDYDDEERHEDFLERCVELEALPFAKSKYEDLRVALGSDPLCEKYLAQVEALLQVQGQMKTSRTELAGGVEAKAFFNWLKAKNWKKALYWTPLVIALFCMLLGLSDLKLRNMIGVGFAIAFLSYGLIILFRGRIRWSDFVD